MSKIPVDIELGNMRTEIGQRRTLAHEAWKATLGVVEAAGKTQQVAEMHRRTAPQGRWASKVGANK